MTQDAAFGRAEAGARLTDALTMFGYGQVENQFRAPGLQFEAGGGIRMTW